MKVELSDTWDQAEKLMAEYVTLWTPLKEYNEGNTDLRFKFIVLRLNSQMFNALCLYILEFESMADQEWIVFQKKIHLIEEFSVKWKNRLEPFTIVTLYIQQELEKYSVTWYKLF